MNPSFLTPCFVINKDRLVENLVSFKMKFEKAWGNNVICAYSVKTNNSYKALDIAHGCGWWLEVVSYSEYRKVFNTSGADNIIINGPGKREELFKAALNDKTIINVDSLDELNRILGNLSDEEVRKQKLGLRINFLIKSRTRKDEDKNYFSRFGINYENGDFEKALNLLRGRGIRLSGLHFHSSSDTRSIELYEELAEKACKLKKEYGLKLKYIDIGGGFLGGRYISRKPSIEEYARTIANTLKKEFNPDETSLILEPGVSIISDAVDYYSKVTSKKLIGNKTVVVLDGSVLHINPFMVERNYTYEALDDKSIIHECILCGSTCMERDVFDYASELGYVEIGDLIIFHNVGAYTYSFNNEFILDRPEIYVV